MTETARTAFALDIDSNPDAYVTAHRAIDESVADALLTERELSVRELARVVAARELAPRAATIDREHAFTHEGYQALVSAGIGALIFPEHLGGSGDSHVAYAAAMEEITAGCAATSLVYMTQMHGAYPISATGTDEQIERFVPPLCRGEAYGSMAISEPDAGSDVAGIKTRAVEVDGGYRLNGSKTFITTGDIADTMVVFATTDPQLGRKGVTALIVEGTTEGLTRGKPFHKMGMHGSSTAELFFEDAFIPADQRLGGEGEGWRIVMASVVKSRISAAAQGVGIARSAYVRASLALHRIHGSRLPADIAFALADLRGELLQGRLLLYATAREVDASSDPSTGHIGIMKQQCTDLGMRVSLKAAGLLGAYGDLADIGVERCLRDAKVTQIYDGTNEVQRLLIARDSQTRMEALS